MDMNLHKVIIFPDLAKLPKSDLTDIIPFYVLKFCVCIFRNSIEIT